MEFFVLLAVAAIVLIAIVTKARARENFRRSVGHYEEVRHQTILAESNLSDVPTVEEFLAARGQAHFLSEIGWERPEGAISRSSIGLQTFEAPNEDTYEFEDDDGYDAFVADTWEIEGVPLAAFTLERVTPSGLVLCDLHSLVTRANGALYLNLYEDGDRKTYAADSRHVWLRNGDRIDNSAFVGIRNGATPEIALQPDAYAVSFEQAASPAFDRVQTSDRRYIIRYVTSQGVSHRVISKVMRYGEDRFSARCHFRWGERRTFLKANLLAVFDAPSHEEISTEAFLKKR